MWPNPNHAWEVELKRQRHNVTAMSGRNFDIALLTGAVWRGSFFRSNPCPASDRTSYIVSGDSIFCLVTRKVQQLKRHIGSFFKDQYARPGIVVAQPAQDQPGNLKDEREQPEIPDALQQQGVFQPWQE